MQARIRTSISRIDVSVGPFIDDAYAKGLGQTGARHPDQAARDIAAALSVGWETLSNRTSGFRLPRGLQSIRHYGLLSNRLREPQLTVFRRLLNVEPTAKACSVAELDYRDRYAKHSQAARSATVRCARAGACCASNGCYPVRRREHRRRIPDEPRPLLLATPVPARPAGTVEHAWPDGPTVHARTPRRLFIACVARTFLPQPRPPTVHPGRCEYCRREHCKRASIQCP